MSTTALDYILLDRQPPVATLTINRPRQRNAINYHMWGELAARLRELDQDREVRAVVITGAGDVAFSARRGHLRFRRVSRRFGQGQGL